MDFEIRPYRPSELAALYSICLLTGAAGKDATSLYSDAKLLGHVYAAPYGVLEPQSCFVVEDSDGIGGYIVGAVETYKFEKRLESEWWPELRKSVAKPAGAPQKFSPDERMQYLIHHPPRTPRRISEPFPSHLHINLLPRLQGRQIGKLLIDRWLQAMRGAGSPGAHLGVGEANARAIRFYRAYGFVEVEKLAPPSNAYIFAVKLSL